MQVARGRSGVLKLGVVDADGSVVGKIGDGNSAGLCAAKGRVADLFDWKLRGNSRGSEGAVGDGDVWLVIILHRSHVPAESERRRDIKGGVTYLTGVIGEHYRY